MAPASRSNSYDASTGDTVIFNGATVLSNVPISGFSFQTTDKFGLGARTGGFAERAVVDDVQIAPSRDAALRPQDTWLAGRGLKVGAFVARTSDGAARRPYHVDFDAIPPSQQHLRANPATFLPSVPSSDGVAS